ncbi:MAG: hypothetical protein NTV30_10945 [Chloroflexi bacterium]|nr:hypothetical protein [Chloroflexota bacterium]
MPGIKECYHSVRWFKGVEIDNPQLSLNLSTYIEKISKETGRQVIFEEARILKSFGTNVAIKTSPDAIVVLYLPDISFNSPPIERAAAREITRAFLLYGKGYGRRSYSRQPEETENKSIGLLFNTLDDIVINKLISSEGFVPFEDNYFTVIEEETEIIRKGKKYHQDLAPDLLFRDRFIACRYVTAWSFLNYFDPDQYNRRKLSKFVKEFQDGFPKQFMIAKELIELIQNNDIFLTEGHRVVVDYALKLWNLSGIITWQ